MDRKRAPVHQPWPEWTSAHPHVDATIATLGISARSAGACMVTGRKHPPGPSVSSRYAILRGYDVGVASEASEAGSITTISSTTYRFPAAMKNPYSVCV